MCTAKICMNTHTHRHKTQCLTLWAVNLRRCQSGRHRFVYVGLGGYIQSSIVDPRRVMGNQGGLESGHVPNHIGLLSPWSGRELRQGLGMDTRALWHSSMQTPSYRVSAKPGLPPSAFLSHIPGSHGGSY